MYQSKYHYPKNRDPHGRIPGAMGPPWGGKEALFGPCVATLPGASEEKGGTSFNVTVSSSSSPSPAALLSSYQNTKRSVRMSGFWLTPANWQLLSRTQLSAKGHNGQIPSGKSSRQHSPFPQHCCLVCSTCSPGSQASFTNREEAECGCGGTLFVWCVSKQPGKGQNELGRGCPWEALPQTPCLQLSGASWKEPKAVVAPHSTPSWGM